MDISGTARRLVDVPKKSVTMAIEAPQHANELFEDVRQLVRRAGRLLDRSDLVVARLEHKLDQFDTLTESATRLIERAGDIADFTDAVSKEMRRTRELTEEQLRRVRDLLDTYEPLLESLAPLTREAEVSLRPEHVRSLVSLLDELPDLVDRFKPALDGMARLTPHFQEVTDRMDNVGQVVEGLPGAKTLRRRGKAREEEAAD